MEKNMYNSGMGVHTHSMIIEIPKKNGEEHHDFCIDEALFYIEKAKESVLASKISPEQHHLDAVEHMKKLTPLVILQGLADS